MKIASKILHVGEDGIVRLRWPTAQEWNDFFAAGFPTVRGPQISNADSVAARVTLFDQTVVSFENVEDEQGPITVEGKERFPAPLKVQAIWLAFERSNDMALEKNSAGTSSAT